jgi:hypothetical protein
MLPEKYKNLCKKHIDTLWSVWRSLGIFSDGPRIPIGFEEAVSGLCTFGRYDQRLFDEALSIIISYSELINKNKCTALLKRMDPDSANVFFIIARLLAEIKADKRFLTLGTLNTTNHDSRVSPFFITLDGESCFSGRKRDQLFEKLGWSRNVFIQSEYVPELSVIATLNPWIRTKLLFGNSVRADVIMELIVNKRCAAPDIARKNGFTQKSVWNVFQDFSAAGYISSTRIRNKIFYSPNPDFVRAYSEFRPRPLFTQTVDWTRCGHFVYHLRKLPANASKHLIASEERRIEKLLPVT